MRDLERLLTGAYPEGLRDVPPAPVRKSAVRDKTFEKLGLERPERQPLPHEQWSQAEPVVKRRRPWAMVAACLAVVALVGAALWALPLATAPGQGQSGPLPAGTYLECSVTEAAFDEESWSMVLTAEATTDLDLDNPNAATGYGISANVAMTTDYSRISFGGLDPDTLTRWTETGENTYRCEGILVEVDPEFQMVNVLIGQLDLNLELYVGFGEQNTAGTWEDFLLADAPFTLELPMPEGSRLDFVRPNPPATYFTCQAVEAAFSQEQQALVFTLEAQTDMDLDNADCQSLYSFLYTLTFQGGKRRLPIPQLRRRHRGRPGPLDPDRGGHLPLRGLHRPRGPGPSGGAGHRRHSRGHLGFGGHRHVLCGCRRPLAVLPLGGVCRGAGGNQRACLL